MAAPGAAPAWRASALAARCALRPLPRSLLFPRRPLSAALRTATVAAAKPPPKADKARKKPAPVVVAVEQPAAPEAPPLERRVSRPPDAVLGAPYGPTGAVRATPRDAAAVAALRGTGSRVLRVSREGAEGEPPPPPALAQARVRALGDGVGGFILHIAGVDTRQRVRASAASEQKSARLTRPASRFRQAKALRGAELYAEQPETPQRPLSLRSSFAAADKAAQEKRQQAARRAAAAHAAAEAAAPPPPPLAWPSLPPLDNTRRPGADVAVVWLPDSAALRAPPPAELAAVLAALGARFGQPRRVLALTDDVTFAWAPARVVASGTAAAEAAPPPLTQLERAMSCRCALCGRGFPTFAVLATHFRRMHASAARRRALALSHASFRGRARPPPPAALFRFREAARRTALLAPAQRATAAGCRAWSLSAAGVAAEPSLDAPFDAAAVRAPIFDAEVTTAAAAAATPPEPEPARARDVLAHFAAHHLAAAQQPTLLLVSDDAAAMQAVATAVAERNAAGDAACQLVAVSSDAAALAAAQAQAGPACTALPWADVAAAASAVAAGGKRAAAAAWSDAPGVAPAAAPDMCSWSNAALTSRTQPRRRLPRRVSRALAARAAARAAASLGPTRAAASLAASMGAGINAAALLSDADDFSADAQAEWRPPPGMGAEKLAAAFADAAAAEGDDLQATADAAAEAAMSRGANAALSDIRRAAAERAPRFAPRGQEEDAGSGRVFVSRANRGDPPQQRAPRRAPDEQQQPARAPRPAARPPSAAPPPSRTRSPPPPPAK
jgi:hypothetical protein